jgi:ribosome-interacting GTPase 1
MPANLSPEYKSAELAFRQAREPGDRLSCLRDMLRTIPKHKGTEHLQADIKSRIKQLTEELSGPRKGAARGGPTTVIHPEGAAQIALIGSPSSGKSALHHALTHSHAEVGAYPYTTQVPQPGMLAHQDVLFQLVDLPPVTSEHPMPWLYNALQPADGCLLVADLGQPDCLDRTADLMGELGRKRIVLGGDWASDAWDNGDPTLADDPFAIRLPALLVISKADTLADPESELAVFRELAGLDFPAQIVSVEDGQGLDAIGDWLFRNLRIVRVYTKIPGRPAEHDRPFTVRRGQTVYDVALQVHKDVANGFKYARIWGKHHLHGQQVGRDHPVDDGDVLEIHS